MGSTLIRGQEGNPFVPLVLGRWGCLLRTAGRVAEAALPPLTKAALRSFWALARSRGSEGKV